MQRQKIPFLVLKACIEDGHSLQSMQKLQSLTLLLWTLSAQIFQVAFHTLNL